MIHEDLKKFIVTPVTVRFTSAESAEIEEFSSVLQAESGGAIVDIETAVRVLCSVGLRYSKSGPAAPASTLGGPSKTPPGTEVTAHGLRIRDLSEVQTAVYNSLREACGEPGIVRTVNKSGTKMSYSEIQGSIAKTGFSVSMSGVIASVNRLEKLGLISVTRPPRGMHQKNVYSILNWPPSA